MGTGIKREKTGDIIILSKGVAIIADKTMISYLEGNFPVIKNNNFNIKVFQLNNIPFQKLNLQKK